MGTAMLMSHGFYLYQDIWKDQPPIFSYLLLAIENLFPGNIIAARALVSLFAVMLLRSLFRIIRRQYGSMAAWTAILLLGTFPIFPRLAVSVMAGLPAIALTVITLDIVMGADKPSRIRIIIAAILFGLALQTKLFVLVFAPGLFLAFALEKSYGSLVSRGHSALLFGILVVVTFFAIAWYSQMSILEDTWDPHMTSELREDYSPLGSAIRIFEHLKPGWVALLFGITGLMVAIWRMDSKALIPFIWLGGASFALMAHTPVWYHHTLLLAVPLAWLGGVFFALVAKKAAATPWLTPSAFLILSVFLIVKTTGHWRSQSQSNSEGHAASQLLANHARSLDEWVVADRPMDAYRARLKVLPELAIYSSKRISAGNLSPSEIVEYMKKWQPAQVLLRRFKIDPVVQAYLDEAYIYNDNPRGFQHYLIKGTLN